jgi:hypothetical protein
MLHPLWQEDGSVVYDCCWSSSAQSFSGFSPAGLMTIFYCLRFETLPTWRARSPYLYPPRTGWPCYTPRHWVPFSSPPTTCRATVEVLDPASTLGYESWLYSSGTDRTGNGSSTLTLCSTSSRVCLAVHYCVFSRVARETMCLQSCSLATAVVLSPVYTAVTWQWVL